MQFVFEMHIAGIQCKVYIVKGIGISNALFLQIIFFSLLLLTLFFILSTHWNMHWINLLTFNFNENVHSVKLKVFGNVRCALAKRIFQNTKSNTLRFVKIKRENYSLDWIERQQLQLGNFLPQNLMMIPVNMTAVCCNLLSEVTNRSLKDKSLIIALHLNDWWERYVFEKNEIK